MAIGLPLRKYLDDDGELDIYPDIRDPHSKPRPVKRNDIYHMLGHILRVTTVKETPLFFNDVRERRVFLTCHDDCNCGRRFVDQLIWPVKLQILERHLEDLTLDKL